MSRYSTTDFNDFFGPNSRVDHLGEGKFNIPETYTNLDASGSPIGPTNLLTPEGVKNYLLQTLKENQITEFTQDQIDALNDSARQSGVPTGFLVNLETATSFLGAVTQGTSTISGNLSSSLSAISGIASSLGFDGLSSSTNSGLSILKTFSTLKSSLGRNPRFSEIAMNEILGSGIANELITNNFNLEIANIQIPIGHPLTTQYQNIGVKLENKKRRTWEEAYHFFSNHFVNGYSTFPTPSSRATGALNGN